MATTMSSREFNQDTSRAKQAAERGPVYITDRGRPAHVLLTFRDYEHLLGPQHITDILGEPPGVEDAELTIVTADDIARPAPVE